MRKDTKIHRLTAVGAGSLALAIAAPLAAAVIQWQLWDLLQPFVWFLFYPAVFFSAWIGGRRGGLVATLLSISLVVYFFVPPQLTWALAREQTWFSIAVFALMGVLFGEFQERLLRVTREADDASKRAHEAELQLERQHTEHAREDSEVRYRQLVEGLPQLVWTCTAEGPCDYLSPRWIEYTGVPAEQQLGSGWLEQVHPDDREPLLKVWGSSVTRGLAFNFEYRIRGRDGTYHWFDARAIPIRDNEGHITRWFGSSTDVQDRRALADSDARYRQLVEGLPQLVWTCSAEGPCDYLSPRWIEYTGVPAEQQLGSGWLEQIHPDDREPLMSVWGSAVTRGLAFNFEYRIRGRDGTYHWFDARAIPIRDNEGHITRWFGSSTDVQDRRALEQASQRQAQLIELSYDPIIAWTEMRGIEFWNRGAQQVYGYTAEQAVGQVSHELLATQFPVSLGDVLEKLHRDGHWTGLLRHVTAGGDLIEVESRMQRLLIDGEYWVLEGNRDVTERRRWEFAIQRLNTELERKVRERTAELSAANAELESFAYAVSHDLRAPLRAMTGFSQALIEDCGPRLHGEDRVHLEQIIIGGRRMGELIDGLLTLSRSTRGELKFERVDLSSMATAICTQLAAAEPSRNVDWQVEPGLVARGDAAMLEVVLRNLLENAWKYTGRTAAPRVWFGCRPDRPGVFFVEDNGAGFDMSHAAKLFQPFQRLHRQDEFAGIGIGLATVQRIVRRHSGEIEATGAVNGGARFTFSLPAAMEAEL